MDKKLKMLLKVSSELVKEKELSKILLKLTEITKTLISVDRSSIFLHDKDKKELWTIVADGVKEIRIAEDKGIAGEVNMSKKHLIINDAYSDSRFNKEIDRKTGYHTRNILTVALINQKQEGIGVFQVINKQDGKDFEQEDVDLLSHLGFYAGSVIENAQLYEKLKKSHEDIIYRLAYATGCKDPETKNHIIRVGLYCATMAKALNWDEEEIEVIRLAAPMHDIGKVGVPDNILKKPGKLTEEEWVIMRKHTLFGYDILKNSDSRLIQVAAILALDHHEKYNGEGYPNGKKMNEISIYGKMTAIADVFDALTSKRHYKEAWSFDRVAKVLEEESGEHFDPKIVKLFLENYDKMLEIKKTYIDEEL